MVGKNNHDITILDLQEANRACKTESDRDRKWHALADGTLSEAEVEELRREAQRGGEARELYELYRPLDAEEREKILSDLRARRHPPPEIRDRSKAPPVAPPPRPFVKVAVVAAPYFAMAAMLAVMLRAPTQTAFAGSVEYVEPSRQRGANDPLAPLRLMQPDARLSLTLTPAYELSFLCTQGSRSHRCKPLYTWSPTGSIIFVSTKEELFPGENEGQWDLCITSGKRGPLQSDDELRNICKSPGDHPEYQVIHQTVILEKPR